MARWDHWDDFTSKERCGNCAYFSGTRNLYNDGSVALSGGKCINENSYCVGKEQNGFGSPCQLYERCGEFQRIITNFEMERMEKERIKSEENHRKELEERERELTRLKQENESRLRSIENYNDDYSFNSYGQSNFSSIDEDDYSYEDEFDLEDFEKTIKSVIFDIDVNIDNLNQSILKLRNMSDEDFEIDKDALASFKNFCVTCESFLIGMEDKEELLDEDIINRFKLYKTKIKKIMLDFIQKTETEIEYHLDNSHLKVAYYLALIISATNYDSISHQVKEFKEKYMNSKLSNAESLYQAAKYSEAILELKDLEETAEVINFKTKCDEQIAEIGLKDVQGYLESEDYKSALELLQQLPTTEKVTELIEKCLTKINKKENDKIQNETEQKIVMNNNPMINLRSCDSNDKNSNKKKYLGWGLLGGSILVIIILVVILVSVLKNSNQEKVNYFTPTEDKTFEMCANLGNYRSTIKYSYYTLGNTFIAEETSEEVYDSKADILYRHKEKDVTDAFDVYIYNRTVYSYNNEISKWEIVEGKDLTNGFTGWKDRNNYFRLQNKYYVLDSIDIGQYSYLCLYSMGGYLVKEYKIISDSIYVICQQTFVVPNDDSLVLELPPME